jgi:hypothetical protein
MAKMVGNLTYHANATPSKNSFLSYLSFFFFCFWFWINFPMIANYQLTSFTKFVVNCSSKNLGGKRGTRSRKPVTQLW